MITIVSGLPRSGTSLLMQMMQAGGMKILTDDIRQPDKNNPRGYYEYQPVKKLHENNSWLGQAEGKAVKIIAPLLQYLDLQYEYYVLFVERDMQEILISQEKMLENTGKKPNTVNNSLLSKGFLRQIEDTKNLLAKSRNIKVLYLDHNEIINYPLEQAEVINQFLKLNLEINSMADIVEPLLYRSKLPERNDQ